VPGGQDPMSFCLIMASFIPGTQNASSLAVRMDPLIDRMESGLRLKILSSTRRKNFFAHLKRAQQVHFANKVADPGKCMVTSIHPAGVGGGHSKHDVVMYTEEAFRLRRRLAKLQRKIVISGRLDR
jgi:hypothetical protein